MSQEHMTQNFSQGGFTQDSFFYKYRWDLCRLYFRWFIKTCKREILNKWVKQATLRRAWAKDSARACPKECIQVKESWDSHKIFQIFHSMIQASSKIIFFTETRLGIRWLIFFNWKKVGDHGLNWTFYLRILIILLITFKATEALTSPNINFYKLYQINITTIMWVFLWVIENPDGEIENSGKSIFEIRITNFCYIQVIVFDLSYLPVTLFIFFTIFSW